MWLWWRSSLSYWAHVFQKEKESNFLNKQLGNQTCWQHTKKVKGILKIWINNIAVLFLYTPPSVKSSQTVFRCKNHIARYFQNWQFGPELTILNFKLVSLAQIRRNKFPQAPQRAIHMHLSMKYDIYTSCLFLSRPLRYWFNISIGQPCISVSVYQHRCAGLYLLKLVSDVSSWAKPNHHMAQIFKTVHAKTVFACCQVECQECSGQHQHHMSSLPKTSLSRWPPISAQGWSLLSNLFHLLLDQAAGRRPASPLLTVVL